jgi:hypothetical protein
MSFSTFYPVSTNDSAQLTLRGALLRDANGAWPPASLYPVLNGEQSKLIFGTGTGTLSWGGGSSFSNYYYAGGTGIATFLGGVAVPTGSETSTASTPLIGAVNEGSSIGFYGQVWSAGTASGSCGIVYIVWGTA